MFYQWEKEVESYVRQGDWTHLEGLINKEKEKQNGNATTFLSELLHLATSVCCLSICEKLLDKGADVNYRLSYGRKKMKFSVLYSCFPPENWFSEEERLRCFSLFLRNGKIFTIANLFFSLLMIFYYFRNRCSC
jgi:hypothetical protein